MTNLERGDAIRGRETVPPGSGTCRPALRSGAAGAGEVLPGPAGRRVVSADTPMHTGEGVPGASGAVRGGSEIGQVLFLEQVRS